MVTFTARVQTRTAVQLQRAAPRRCAASRSPVAVVRRQSKATRPLVVTAALVAPQEGVHDTPFHWLRNALLSLWTVFEEPVEETQTPAAVPEPEEAPEAEFDDF